MPILTTLGAACAKAWGFTSGLAKDQYFNLVSLLLPGNGTNGAQNNTFLDSSTNNFTITRNGNTTQGTFSPFSQTGWGAYFDGSNDNVSFASGSQVIPATGDFTIEAWIYPTSVAAGVYNVIYAQTNGGASAGRTSFQTDGSNIAFQCAGTYLTSSSGTLTANRWNYIAATRTGSSVSLYVNGSATTGLTASGSIDSGTSLTAIGANWSPQYMAGYISNFRVSTTIRSNLTTVPTSPFTNDANTRVLTLQNNRFIDNSSSPFTLTANNGVAITPFSPFAPTAAYTTAAVGGSGYFDGTGDYLSVAYNAALNLGVGDFCVEAYVYKTSASGNDWKLLSGTTSPLMFFGDGGTASSRGLGWGNAIGGWEFISGVVTPTNEWAHICFTRLSGVGRIFLNGYMRGYTASNATNLDLSSAPMYIGSDGSYLFQGYMNALRITKGSVPTNYQTSATTVSSTTQIFVPPTSPITTTSQGSSSPSLLLNFTNAGITDATAKNDLETVGNAQISTSVSKFGGGSIAFDGTGDYLYRPDTALNQLGTGDYTIELWLYPNSFSNTPVLLEYGRQAAGSTPGLELFVATTSGRLDVYGGSAANTLLFSTTSTNIATGTWTHIALTRASGTTRLYFNGTQPTGSSVSDTTNYTQANIWIGAYIGGTASLNGYIDDFRITRGLARYTTTSFTPPTAPFPVQ